VFITGILLAAGASRRLGRPKQLLPYNGATLLESTLRTAHDCAFDQLLVALGGAALDVRAKVDLSDAEVVDNPSFESGCGSSIRTAIDHIDERAEGAILLLGDQPGVTPSTVRGLIAQASESSIGICRYRDGLGHPFWFNRSMFAELASLHGDKAAWKLLNSGRFAVAEVTVDAPVPIDVDTWDDYRSLLLAEPAGVAR